MQAIAVFSAVAFYFQKGGFSCLNKGKSGGYFKFFVVRSRTVLGTV
jgi:hypothetical protein